MKQLLVACGDVELLKRILSQIPRDQFKPIATKKGAGTAQKVAGRPLAGAIVHAQLADGATEQLLQGLQTHLPNTPILLLSPDSPPADGLFERALRYPVPGPVLRNALRSMISTQTSADDRDRWRAFYKEVKARLDTAAQQSYYGLLGVEDGAPHHKLVTAFDRLSMRYHPDRYSQHRGKAWGDKLFREVNSLYKLLTEAYGVVSDRRLRKKYEQALSRGELRLDPDEVNATDKGPQSLAELANTDKARRFLKMAQTDLAKGAHSSALQNLQFAASMEPDNAAIQKKIDRLKAQA